jgi:hypothetical protein
MESVTLPQSVNVMLTPQFYTLKKEALPVKYAFQAKKIAPSLFEGLLEDGSNYEYLVHKEEDGWAFIAYDMQKITAFLESKGIYAPKVNKLFFAQQAVEHFSAPLALNEKEALVVIDETVVVVPRNVLSEEEQPSLAFDSHFTPKSGGVRLKGSTAVSSVVTEKQAYLLAGVFLMFAAVFAVEGARYGNSGAKEAEGKLQELYDAYPTLQSSYTRQAVMEKYKTLDTMERKKRDVVKALSGMIFKGVTLTSLNVNQTSFKAEFSCEDEKVAKRVAELAKKAKYNSKKVQGSNDLSIEGML